MKRKKRYLFIETLSGESGLSIMGCSVCFSERYLSMLSRLCSFKTTWKMCRHKKKKKKKTREKIAPNCIIQTATVIVLVYLLLLFTCINGNFFEYLYYKWYLVCGFFF